MLAASYGALLATACQLSGGSLAAPLTAQACVLADAYIFLDPPEAGRASVPPTVLALLHSQAGSETYMRRLSVVVFPCVGVCGYPVRTECGHACGGQDLQTHSFINKAV